jgi:hypothetical protein
MGGTFINDFLKQQDTPLVATPLIPVVAPTIPTSQYYTLTDPSINDTVTVPVDPLAIVAVPTSSISPTVLIVGAAASAAFFLLRKK